MVWVSWCGPGAGNGGGPPTLAVAPGPPRINLRVLVTRGEPGTRAVDTDDATPLVAAGAAAVRSFPPAARRAAPQPPPTAGPALSAVGRVPPLMRLLFAPLSRSQFTPCPRATPSSARQHHGRSAVRSVSPPTPLPPRSSTFALPVRGLAPAHLLRRASPLFTPLSRSWHNIFLHQPPEVRCTPPPFVRFPPKPFPKQLVPFPLPTCPLSLQRVHLPHPPPPSRFLPRRPSISLAFSTPCPFFPHGVRLNGAVAADAARDAPPPLRR